TVLSRDAAVPVVRAARPAPAAQQVADRVQRSDFDRRPRRRRGRSGGRLQCGRSGAGEDSADPLRTPRAPFRPVLVMPRSARRLTATEAATAPASIPAPRAAGAAILTARRPVRKSRISQPRSAATLRSAEWGLAASARPTAESIGRSLIESL